MNNSFRQFVQKLIPLYSEREARHIADMVFEKVTCFTRLDRITMSDFPLTALQKQKIEEMEKQLIDYMPVQYVLGEAWFYNLKLKVNSNVLIPRPETEELVSWIIEDIKKGKKWSSENGIPSLRGLDIGTGSGCIAIALKKNIPAIKMIGIDKSDAAVQVAKENGMLNQADVDFEEADMTDTNFISHLPDLEMIVSNPPYVPLSEKREMQPQVALYEPAQALFAPDEDPLFFYKAILKISAEKLVNEGSIYFEIDEGNGKEILGLMEKNGFKDATLRKDLSGHDRMIRGTKQDRVITT
ncbi:MAG: peptide chain release factor N(5)-glutamine methyltransferase [Chitinophagaceae bacterium]